jgi:hypothetical protein
MKSRGLPGADGVEWDPLTEEYAKREKRAGGLPIGRRTERLMKSFEPGSSDGVFQVSAGEITIGTRLDYARHFHEDRPIWPDELPETWEQPIRAAIVRHMPQIINALLKG